MGSRINDKVVRPHGEKVINLKILNSYFRHKGERPSVHQKAIINYVIMRQKPNIAKIVCPYKQIHPTVRTRDRRNSRWRKISIVSSEAGKYPQSFQQTLEVELGNIQRNESIDEEYGNLKDIMKKIATKHWTPWITEETQKRWLSGPENIPGRPYLEERLAQLMSTCSLQTKIPSVWRHSHFGHRRDPNCYRSLSVNCTIGRLFSKVINEKVRQNIEHKIGEDQSGFTPGSSYTDNHSPTAVLHRSETVPKSHYDRVVWHKPTEAKALSHHRRQTQFSMGKESLVIETVHNTVKQKGKWSEEEMKHAVNAVTTNKMSAAERYQVPRSTLGDRLKGIKKGKAVDLTPQMASSSKVKFQRRKQRSEQNEVLTSSPYKNELPEKMRVVEEKKQSAAKRKLEKDTKIDEMCKRRATHKGNWAASYSSMSKLHQPLDEEGIFGRKSKLSTSPARARAFTYAEIEDD
ncbi:hypothetical protein ILUMI_03783 [Ignelater luminosus]|uniref:HTH psq-type domain-containing protein n=1 Tax=Ignelater luminosus TaxID=2038154 RepID=A0A8K0GK56_IGNLU|nr:hypothetical protein ILUMI_03783 [Ignelater luminosus]